VEQSGNLVRGVKGCGKGSKRACAVDGSEMGAKDRRNGPTTRRGFRGLERGFLDSVIQRFGCGFAI
jgi:hypothetical protein